METRELQFGQKPSSALCLRPHDAFCCLVFAHGAGAGMRHRFMDEMAHALAHNGVATFRFQFPYMDAGRRRPDARPTLLQNCGEAIAAAREAAGGLPVFVGGKSMGGRMCSLWLSDEPDANVAGVVFFGFPLHPAGRPGTERADHLDRVAAPMLFLHGDRDRLAEPALLDGVVARLGDSASLHRVGEADHSFHVPRRTGATDGEVIEALADVVARWCEAQSPPSESVVSAS